MSYLRKILLFLIAVAMVAVGLLVGFFGLSATGFPRIVLFIAGGAVVAFIGLWLLWEDFIAPLFAHK